MTRSKNCDSGPKALPKRQRLPPDERRGRILDAAQNLFFTRGWDDVTIADVLVAAEISKGGFYHHFAAKEDLLDGVVERSTKEALSAAETVYHRTSGNALARFNAFLAETSRWKVEQAAQIRFFMRVMTRPGNDFLFYRISNAAALAAKPVVEKMIAEGIADGSFNVTDADLVAEMILVLSQGRRFVAGAAVEAADAGDLEKATMVFDNRMKAEGALIDRLLGLPLGSIALANPTMYSRMFRAIAKE